MDAPHAKDCEQSSPDRCRPLVLAVDDQRDAGRILQMQLQAAGMDCILCSGGADALATARAHPIDVIILDVMMPEMDGYQVCEELKRDERTRDIPVLFLTAKYETEERVRGLGLGGHDYLLKPVQTQELLARTRAALRVKQLQDQLKEKIVLQQHVDQLHQVMMRQHWQNTLGQLAASLAHEINNPLTVALGNIQLLDMGQFLSPEAHQRLHAADQSLQRVSTKLRSLLLIAHDTPTIRRVNLAQLVEDVLALVNYQVLVTGITLAAELDRSCRWTGVPRDLACVVLALLNNAIEAVENANPARIAVKIMRVGSRLAIRVSDSGPGLVGETAARVFEPFFTTKKAPHHGIGLALARELISAAHGSIEHRSHGELGGAEFTIWLPESLNANCGMRIAD